MQDKNLNFFEAIEDETLEKENYLSVKRNKKRERAIERGFTDEYHMAGWHYFNRIDNSQYEGYSVDVFHYADGESGTD